MERNYILHFKNGESRLVKESEAIQNALDQEKIGVKPHYVRRDYKTGEKITPSGWLVWSTWEDGAGVVYRREKDGKFVLTTGWQADFVTV